MRNKLKIAAVVAVAASLSACAQDDLQIWKRGGSGSKDFQAALAKGKAPAGMSPTSPRGFSLSSNPNVITTEVDPGDGRASFVSYNTELMPNVARAELQSAALAHVDANSKSFGVPSSELRPMENAEIEDPNGNVTVSFQRFVEGIPVDSSLMQVTFAPAGNGSYRIRHVVNHTYGDIKLSATEKLNVSDAGLAASMGLDRMVELEESRVIYPTVNEKGVYQHTLATRLKLEDPESGEHFIVTAKAGGEVLEAVSSRTHAIHQLLMETWDRTPGTNKRITLPLSFVTVQNAITDKDGKADLTVGQPLTIALNTPTTGSRAMVQTAPAGYTQSRNVLSITVPTTANTDKTTYALTAASLPSVNSYVRVNMVADFVKQYLPNNAMVSRQIPIYVNITGLPGQPNANCNAFYDGASLNFFETGNGCQNTALIDDVVYHEWGHGLDDLTGPARGITDGAYSEGIGDILSMLLTGSNNLAPGFIVANPAAGIRNLENPKKYPGDLVNEVHDDGEIIGATFWDMRKAMVTRYGQTDGVNRVAKIFLNSLATTTRYLDSYQQALLLDDNDANPATRSPNYCLINAAYAAHGLATAEANCVDVFTSNDDSLRLAIAGMTGVVNVTLYGSSSAESAKIGLCIGDRDTCVNSKKVDVAFSDFATTPEGIKIYKSDTALDLTEGMAVTILGFGADGNVRGAAAAKFTRQPQ